MIIKQCIICNSKRFRLKSYEKVTFKPHPHFNLIIGPNGIGKSSLLHYTSPLPKDKNEYNKNGYSEIVIWNNNNEYILSTNKYGSGRHSFIKNGEELNQGYTRKLYTLLLENELGITSNIYDILLGYKTVTSISLNERREWITSISKVSYDYAYTTLKKLQKKRNNLNGALALLKRKVVDLESHNDDTRIKEINGEITEAKELRELIYSNLKQVNVDDPTRELMNAIRTLRAITNKIDYLDTSEIDMIDKEVAILDREIISLREKLSKIANIDIPDNIDDINQQVSNIECKLNEYGAQINTELLSLYNYYINIEQTLRSNLTKADEILRAGRVVNNEIEVSKLNEEYKKLLDTEQYLNSTIKLLKDSNEISKFTCSSCNTINIIDKYGKEIDEKVRELSSVNIRIAEVKPKVDAVIEEYNRYKSVTAIINTINSLITPLIEVGLLEPITIDANISSYETKLIEVYNKLKEAYEVDKLSKKLSELKKMQLLLSTLSNTMTIKELENSLKSKVQLREELSKKLDRLKKAKLAFEELVNARHKVRSLIAKYKAFRGLKISKKISEYYRYALTVIDGRISELEKEVNSIQSANRLKAEYTKEIEVMEQELELVKEMIIALGPKTGLIGDSIKGFMSYIAQEMTKIISDIWEYPMEILVPDDEENISYRLYIRINQEDIIPDITLGSAGMKEVIDLAFLIVYTELKNLNSFPLYLDEFGKTFDVRHAKKALSFVQRLAERYNRQVFMISHLEYATRLKDSSIGIINLNKENEYIQYT